MKTFIVSIEDPDGIGVGLARAMGYQASPSCFTGITIVEVQALEKDDAREIAREFGRILNVSE